MKRTTLYLALGLLLASLTCCRVFKMGHLYLSENHQKPRQELVDIYNDSNNTFNFAYADKEIHDYISELNYVHYSRKKRKAYKLSDYLDSKTKTTAFIVIRNDSILFEEYYEGYDHNSLLPSWSIAKSFVGALAGIAIHEGYLSQSDYVTEYFPELSKLDKNYSKLKIEHLLNMRSGIDFDEEDYINPYSDVADLYMSKDVTKIFEKVQFKYEPGQTHYYSSFDTEILTLVLEQAIDKPLSIYLQEKLFIPLGMESAGTWTIDSKKANHTKGFCCLNLTLRDYAKFASLYLKNGKWNNVQLIDSTWITQCTLPDFENDCYQNQWYSQKSYLFSKDRLSNYTYKDSLSAQRAITNVSNQRVVRHWYRKDEWIIKSCGEAFYALGVFGQEIYIDPTEQMIFIRLGKKWDTSSNKIFNLIKSELNGYK